MFIHESYKNKIIQNLHLNCWIPVSINKLKRWHTDLIVEDVDQLSLAMKPVHWCAVYVKERSIIDHVVTTGVAVVLDPSCILLTRRRVASDGTPRLIISSLICRRKHRVLLRYHQYSLRYDDDDEVRQPNRKYNDKQSTHSSPECVRFSMAAIQNCIQDKHLV